VNLLLVLRYVSDGVKIESYIELIGKFWSEITIVKKTKRTVNLLLVLRLLGAIS
jgi:hypothetical protein